LFFRKGQCVFIAFDLLYLNGKDLRTLWRMNLPLNVLLLRQSLRIMITHFRRENCGIDIGLMAAMPPSSSVWIQIRCRFALRRRLRALGRVGMMRDGRSRSGPALPLERLRTISEVQCAATYPHSFA